MEAVENLFKLGASLFGDDRPAPQRPDAPENPDVTPGTNHPDEQQAHEGVGKAGKKLDESVRKANEEGGGAAEDVKKDKARLDALFKELEKNIKRTSGGNNTETQQGTDQAIRDGVRDMRNLVGGAADNNAARANGLAMPAGMSSPLAGGGIPGMGGGIPGMGGGFPGMGAGGAMPGGAGAQGFNPFDPSQHPPLAGNPMADPTQPGSPAMSPASHDPGATDPNHPNPNNPAGPGGQGNAHAIIADPAAVNSHDLVAPDGTTKTTAPDDVSATVLKHAASHPNTPNWVEASYKAAGIDLPGNGADPGKSIDINNIQPGDIVRFSDHDVLVWGNGKVMNHDGTTQDIGPAIDAGTLKGIYRPERSTGGAPASNTNPATDSPQHPPAAENG
ncbi:hypothetical protein [Mycobacteroides salmoniphilum]|nr:hypothetical protein [Mycobacteroides salmoniphilum]